MTPASAADPCSRCCSDGQWLRQQGHEDCLACCIVSAAGEEEEDEEDEEEGGSEERERGGGERLWLQVRAGEEATATAAAAGGVDGAGGDGVMRVSSRRVLEVLVFVVVFVVSHADPRATGDSPLMLAGAAAATLAHRVNNAS